MTPDGNQIFGVALTAMWATVGAYGLYQVYRQSKVARDFSAAVKRMKVPMKAATLAGLIAVVAIGGSKPGGSLLQRRGAEAQRQLGSAALRLCVENPPFTLKEANTNFTFVARSEESVVSQDGLLLGASESGEWIEFDHPIFKFGTNEISRLYASPGVLSFETKRHPALGCTLPYGDNVKSLVALRMPLGLVPQANWQYLSAPCRFWHEETSSGVVFTWENILLDRQADQPATVQIELEKSGAFTYRYDFTRSAPTNSFLIGAQHGGTAVTAFRASGATTNATSVYRVQGASVTNGVSVADLLAASQTLELRWENVAGLGDLSGDTDGDGLIDWDEIHLYGTDPRHADTDGDGLSDLAEVLSSTNPLDADEDGDGVPDGVDEDGWATHDLWAENHESGANCVVTLLADVSTNGSAALLFDDLSIPLHQARSWQLRIPTNRIVRFALRTTGDAAASLQLSPPPDGPLEPVHLDDPSHVFSVHVPSGRNAAPRRAPALPPASTGGEGHLDIFDFRFVYAETGEPATQDECIHDADGSRRYRIQILHQEDEGMAPTWSDAMPGLPGYFELHVSDVPNDRDSWTGSFSSPALAWGTRTLAQSIHRCAGGPQYWCHACAMYHSCEHSDDSCPHDANCPQKTDPESACTCTPRTIRISDVLEADYHDTFFHFPEEPACCCSQRTLGRLRLRIKTISPNLYVADADRIYKAGDTCPIWAAIYAEAISGAEPSRVEFETLREFDLPNGGVSNAVIQTSCVAVWVIDIQFSPIGPERVGTSYLNPCSIVKGETETFGLSIVPTQFPESSVSWSASPINRASFPHGNLGRHVEIRASQSESPLVVLRANIAGYEGPSPTCRFAVVPETYVSIHAFIVSDGARAATSSSDLLEKVDEVNRIWHQAGVRFSVASMHEIVDASLLTHSAVSNTWPTLTPMFSHTNGTGGVELYVVDSLGTAAGLSRGSEIAVCGSASGSTLAHELGHAMGLKDIYPTDLTNANVRVSGPPTLARLPSDWGSDSEEGYYPRETMQTNVIHSLLMDGSGLRSGTVLPFGRVHGIWYPDGYDHPSSETPALVGFVSLQTRNPHSD